MNEDDDWNQIWDGDNISVSDDTTENRVIIHLDIDCFYAQAEMLKDPDLRSKPIAIVQKQLVITTNYVARNMGVPKSGWLRDLEKKFPSLIFINGEDLQDYRRFSQQIFQKLSSFKCPVERLGMDENFLDVTQLVEEMLANDTELPAHPEGIAFAGQGDNPVISRRLLAGTVLAAKMRKQVFQEIGFTLSGGIAHNKLLAKLVGSQNKPDRQTYLHPNHTLTLMNSLSSARAIPGIGSSTFSVLKDHGISAIQQLQGASLSTLEQWFDTDMALRLKSLSFGEDKTPVKMSGKVQVLGLEDRFPSITTVLETKEKTKWLLGRLLKLLWEDGRLPQTLRVTARDYLKYGERRKFFKESRQCKISPSLFISNGPNNDKLEPSLLDVSHKLLEKMVDFEKPFELKLLGLTFADLIEKQSTSKRSISSFFTPLDGMAPSNNSGTDNKDLKRKCISNDSDEIIPPEWDEKVFKSLPQDMQRELMNARKSSFAINSPTNVVPKKIKKTNILHYFQKPK